MQINPCEAHISAQYQSSPLIDYRELVMTTDTARAAHL